jgi:ABC-type tungstate transport system permease subunit
MIAPAMASADTSSTLTVIGTSDVSDSGLMSNVIQPGFQKQFPQYAFKYIGTGTGNAISMAESGAAGASNLIVHAASLENQFVANGYSQEQYGRALWINDFVLAGNTADPAGIKTGAPHDIARAFAAVAASGIAGKSTFVSRGGTPGTTVQEHAIWQLMAQSGLSPAGLLLCGVSSANGGGWTPIAAGQGVTASGQACPGAGALPKGAALPKWYVATGLTQGPNVQAANACNGFPSGANSCYVFTDGGTYDYLASGTDPAGTIPALTVVSNDNSSSAPGGQFELTNYFHGYIINPNKPNQTVNVPAATAFMNYITSPDVQKQVGAYLASASGGAPFKPTASPILSGTRFASKFFAGAGKKMTVKGTLTNAQPGYPALSGKQVSIANLNGNVQVQVAKGKTDSTGKFSISFVPPKTGNYVVSTAQISMIEDSKLSPVFGDLLSPAVTAQSKVSVTSAITKLNVRAQTGQALIFGTVSPGNSHSSKAAVTILAKQVGSKKGFKKVATTKLAANDANFAAVAKLASGKWLLQVKYGDSKVVTAARTRTTQVNVKAKPKTGVSFKSVKVNKGSVTLKGAIKPSAVKGGATVEVLAMRTSGGSASFGEKASVKVKQGKTAFTAHFKLKQGVRWVLRLVNNQNGLASSNSGLKTINVK